tara:strand:- start:8333 stop:8623 length:291 start_codon:yes stop_codon:yes gene_type:complete
MNKNLAKKLTKIDVMGICTSIGVTQANGEFLIFSKHTKETEFTDKYKTFNDYIKFLDEIGVSIKEFKSDLKKLDDEDYKKINTIFNGCKEILYWVF